MLTMAQVLDERGVREIHLIRGYNGTAGCTFEVGPRGGVKHRPVVARRNGRVQVWKTRPEDYSAPFKYGLREAFRLTPYEARNWTTADDCEACCRARAHYEALRAGRALDEAQSAATSVL